MLRGIPQPGKAKSRRVVEAFCAGAPKEAEGGVFYGVVGLEREFRGFQTRKPAVDWFYGDNAYFDAHRGTHFRFVRNAFQPSETGRPDHARAKRLGLIVKPWRRDGRHVVVVEQSEHFLGLAGEAHGWASRTVEALVQHTDREIRIRRWTRDKDKAASGLTRDLQGAWALVTHGSAAANEALLAGVPVFLGMPCAASPFASGPLERIESPAYNDGREEWAGWLARMMWTLDEMREGRAWRELNP